MAKSNEDLAREIKELKEEVQQMKEIMTLLLNMVVEQEDDEGDEDFVSYPGMATTSDFKNNN
jgi:hypothetical protein